MGETKNYTATIWTGDTAVSEGIEGEWLGEWEQGGQRRWSGVANA